MASNDKTDIFANLTTEDKQNILKLQERLGIKSNDAFLLILAALQYYERLYLEVPEKIIGAADRMEEAAQSRLAAAASEIVKQSSGQLIDVFRSDFAAMTWRRAIWAGLVLLVVGVGSWGAGEVDVWWHSRQISSLNKQLSLLHKEKELLTGQVSKVILNCPAADGIRGGPCVPIDVAANVANHFDTDTINGKTVYFGRLDIEAIKALSEK